MRHFNGLIDCETLKQLITGSAQNQVSSSDYPYQENNELNIFDLLFRNQSKSLNLKA